MIISTGSEKDPARLIVTWSGQTETSMRSDNTFLVQFCPMSHTSFFNLDPFLFFVFSFLKRIICHFQSCATPWVTSFFFLLYIAFLFAFRLLLGKRLSLHLSGLDNVILKIILLMHWSNGKKHVLLLPALVLPLGKKSKFLGIQELL